MSCFIMYVRFIRVSARDYFVVSIMSPPFLFYTFVYAWLDTMNILYP